MNWKRFKQLAAMKQDDIDESSFILGIDLGNNTSAIAFYDFKSKQPSLIDISGGYSKPTVPTAMQYVMETKEWVFGEYAILNNGGKNIKIDSLIDRLGSKEYIDIGDRPISIVHVLSLYLKELIGNVKNINPKAEIAGIIVSIPSYLSEDVKDELLLAFKNAGYEKEIIALIPDRECILANYCHNKEFYPEKLMILDLGGREMRGGVYSIIPEKEWIKADCLSSFFSNEVGTNKLDESVKWMFTQMYCISMNKTVSELDRQTKEHLDSFLYQYKDLLFQKNLSNKPIRLYFNFAYPPFQHSVTKADIDEITSDYKSKFNSFIHATLEKNIYDGQHGIPAGEIDTVLCTGGGFEMLWVREAVKGIFPKSNILFHKNTKSITAEGAAIIAAQELGVIESKRAVVNDKNQIMSDYGVNIHSGNKERFIPVIERNTFWWQNHEPKMFIINDDCEQDARIDLIQRDKNGDTRICDVLVLDGLPKRPRGTTRLRLSMRFVTHETIEVCAYDYGFGDLFPKTDYQRNLSFSV